MNKPSISDQYWANVDRSMLRLSVLGPCPDEKEAHLASECLFNELLVIAIIETNREAIVELQYELQAELQDELQAELQDELQADSEDENDGGRNAPLHHFQVNEKMMDYHMFFHNLNTKSYIDLLQLAQTT